MFHYATDREAENLRHACADEIGDDDAESCETIAMVE